MLLAHAWLVLLFSLNPSAILLPLVRPAGWGGQSGDTFR